MHRTDVNEDNYKPITYSDNIFKNKEKIIAKALTGKLMVFQFIIRLLDNI